MRAKIKKLKWGFSMLEVMISVFVLTIGLLAVVALISKSISQSMDSRNSIIAAQLAQEGVELVRNVRDNNMASGVGTFAYFPATNQTNCIIDKTYTYPSSGDIDCVNTFSDEQLKISSNFYVHSAGTATRFYRRIEIAGTGDRTVTSRVIWKGSSFALVAADTDCTVGRQCVYARATLADR